MLAVGNHKPLCVEDCAEVVSWNHRRLRALVEVYTVEVEVERNVGAGIESSGPNLFEWRLILADDHLARSDRRILREASIDLICDGH